MSKKGITKREDDYSQWYLDIVDVAQLAENSAVRGCMVIKPYGFAIWENYKKELDRMFKETGHENAYFPIFIPKSLLSKEADHVEGFAMEAAVVTHHRLKVDKENGGVMVDEDAKLSEELIVRPTSETIIYDTYSKWVESWRDLPILVNQWANVVRWELRTRPFLRTAEFLWQEGHTAHATFDEAEEESLKMLEVYRKFAEEYLAIPAIPGKKSESEKFAGALHTYTIESMMQDKKALQSGTSHNLGQNFAKAFDIKFTDKDGSVKNVWQTSWGFSTRMIGGLIMTHSDDLGLVLPPKIAPIQVVIVPIWKKEEQAKGVLEFVGDVAQKLRDEGIYVKVDERDYETPGYKFNEWEKKGVPVRLEVGPRDLEKKQVVVVRRDTGKEGKQFMTADEFVSTAQATMDDIQSGLYERALKFRNDNTFEVEDYEEFKKKIEEDGGFALAYWDGTKETEELIKNETKATTRCIPFEYMDEDLTGKVDMRSGKPAKHRIIYAKAY